MAAALALASACSPRAAGPAAAERAALTVTVVAPARRDVTREIVASGSVAAWEEVSLGVELAGVRVARVLVEVGDVVRAGQPLVELDRRSLDVAARQADAGVAQARAGLDLARAAATRGASLVAQKLISSSNNEELTANLSKAQAQLASAEAERDSAKLRLAYATLRAPDAGVVSSRTVQPGQIVASGNELLRLIRRGRLEWRAEVADADLGRIAIGAVVELAGPQGEPVRGLIRAVSPAVDPKTRTALIYADLPQPGPLRAGMFAEGRLLVGTASVQVLPREAVVYRDGVPYVFIVDDRSRVAQRRVEVGGQKDGFIEMRTGIAAGERAVVSGAGFLGDGDVVRVVERAAANVAPKAAP